MEIGRDVPPLAWQAHLQALRWRQHPGPSSDRADYCLLFLAFAGQMILNASWFHGSTGGLFRMLHSAPDKYRVGPLSTCL